MPHTAGPFVSVIIPTHNRRELLRATIESLFNQTYAKDSYEIVVIDNASTDDTEGMVRSLQDAAPCILVYYRKLNEGPGIARNIGIKEARGSIVAFTESDCIADPHWLENGVSKMTDGVGLVQGKTLPNPDQPITAFSHTQSIHRENGIYQTCNIFYRKDILDLVGGFSPEFIGLDCFGNPMMGGEDTDLAWRVKKRGWKSVFADDALVYHHVFSVRPYEAITNFRMYQILLYVFPYLVKKHPELRDVYFYRRLFLSKKKALFDLFFVSIALGLLIHYGIFLFAFPYLAFRFKSVFKGRPLKTYHRGLFLIFYSMIMDFICSIMVALGSIRYRIIIL
jgi:glycosyltransferase involved in cell wall biosynthesis